MNYVDELFGRRSLGIISAKLGVNHVLAYMAFNHFANKTI